MAKYNINYSCGHMKVVNLFGKETEREKKIKYFENYGICYDCYREQKEIEKSVGCDEVEMSYKEYKTNYANCNTKAGSYDGERKTIIVYVKNKEVM